MLFIRILGLEAVGPLVVFFFFFLRLILVFILKRKITRANTSKEKTRRKQRTPPLRHAIFHLWSLQDAQTPPPPATKSEAAGGQPPRDGRSPSPKTLKSRKSHQLPGAGFEVEEDPSAGDHPQASSSPDPGPVPLHLHGGGQIFRQHATFPRSSRPAPPSPVFYTPLTNLPPPPDKAAADRRHSCSQTAPPKTTPRRGSCRAAKR